MLRPREAAAEITTAEQRLEEVAELLAIASCGVATVELESLIPVRWRPKILALLPVRAELIIGSVFLGDGCRC
jgi:hypothetical protein